MVLKCKNSPFDGLRSVHMWSNKLVFPPVLVIYCDTVFDTSLSIMFSFGVNPFSVMPWYNSLYTRISSLSERVFIVLASMLFVS